MVAEAQENRLLAALGYPFWIVAVVVVLTSARERPYMRYHAWQALFYGLAWVAVWIAVAILMNVPVVGWVVALVAGPVLWFGWLGLSLYFAYRAFQGEQFTIPTISDLARHYSEAR
jgi:uncharacterized membrane protein